MTPARHVTTRRGAGAAGRLRAAAAALLALLVLVPTLATVPAAGAGPAAREPARGTDELLSIASVSPWVEHDGEFQVRFEPSPDVPPDAELTVTVHQSLDEDDDLRDVVTGILEGDSPGRILQRPRTRPVSELGDPASGLVLTIPIRSERADSDRVLVPNPGIHPIHLLLTAPDGPELWSQVVFLNRLPADRDGADPDPPLRVTLLVPIESGPAVEVGDGGFTLEERSTLGSTAALLGDADDLPLTLAPVPNTLDGLALSGERWAEELLEEVGDTEAPRSLVARPYVQLDAGALVAAGARDELRRQIDLGGDTVERVGRRSARRDTWVLDDELTPAALPVLAAAGIDSLVLPSSALALPDGLDPDDVAARPVRLEGTPELRALAVDETVSDHLARSSGEPGVRAHEIVTLLMATWFAHRGGEGAAASVVLVGSGTDPAVLQALAPGVTSSSGPLRADPTLAPVPTLDRDDDSDPVALAPRPPTDVRGAVRAMADTRRLTDAYRSMTGEGDPELWKWERANDQSLSSAIDDARRLQLHFEVRSAIQGRTDEIELPPARRVVVTSEQTTIPLRFRNGLDFDVELVLTTRSPRLEFEHGRSRTIVLHPGENRVDLPVTVRAPGESLLRIELSSPVPGIELDGPDVPVRSTAISGVGAALSIVSVLFLVGWWVHTHRRRRRDSAKLSGVHPSGVDGAGSVRAGG